MILLALPAWAVEFGLGSYGRVQASTNVDGGQGEPASVVLYPIRLQKDPYLELDAWFHHELEDGTAFRVVVTPAISGDLFHYDGEWNADLAIRNLYAEASGFGPVYVWVGSRMLRGDDVYQLDFWPMDELNTVGGGVMVKPTGWSLGAHVGLSRPTADEYQLQYYDVPLAGGVGTESVLTLDRQRIVGSLKASKEAVAGDTTFRVSAYGEGHFLPAGTRKVEADIDEELPADGGGLGGVQLSAWGWADGAFVHVWGRMATGLACWDTTDVPKDGFATDGTVAGAREMLVATSVNEPIGPAAVMVGGYVRRFTDADNATSDPDDRWESNVAIRPAVHVGKHVQLAVELSHEWLRPDGLNPRTGTWDVPELTKVAVMPAIQLAPKMLSRPQLRLQYLYTYLNDDARLWYPEADPRHATNHVHSIGVGAEWWIGSASYQ